MEVLASLAAGLGGDATKGAAAHDAAKRYIRLTKAQIISSFLSLGDWISDWVYALQVLAWAAAGLIPNSVEKLACMEFVGQNGTAVFGEVSSGSWDDDSLVSGSWEEGEDANCTDVTGGVFLALQLCTRPRDIDVPALVLAGLIFAAISGMLSDVVKAVLVYVSDRQSEKRDAEIAQKSAELMADFDEYDKDNDGQISAEELRDAMVSQGKSMTKEEAEEMIGKADDDNDGKIDLDEFSKLMASMKDAPDVEEGVPPEQADTPSSPTAPESDTGWRGGSAESQRIRTNWLGRFGIGGVILEDTIQLICTFWVEFVCKPDALVAPVGVGGISAVAMLSLVFGLANALFKVLQGLSKVQKGDFDSLSPDTQSIALKGLSENDRDRFIEKLFKKSQMRDLSLADNNLDDKWAKMFARRVLFIMPQLERLDLSGNEIGDEGAKEIAENLSHCPQLAHLVMQGNDMQDNYKVAKTLRSNAPATCKIVLSVDKDEELLKAVKGGKKDEVAFWVTEGASADAKDGDGSPALACAAYGGHLDALKLLRRHGANLDATGEYGQTALMRAAYEGRADCAEALLEWGADKDATASDGRTALHYAAWKGQLECARLLVRARADRAKKNKSDQTAFELARQEDKFEVAVLLKQADADDNKALAQAAEKGELQTMERLIAEGVSADAKSEHGTPALYLAATYGHLDALKLLRKHGAKLDATDSTGSTALMAGASMGKADCAEALLEWGADKDAADSDGDTALHYAAWKGQLECARLLVEARADRAKKNEEGKTALDKAREYGKVGVAAMMEQADADEEQPRP